MPDWLVAVSGCVNVAWLFACMVWFFVDLADREPPRIVVWLASELRPLYWPASLIVIVASCSDGVGWLDALNAACTVINWYVLKDKHDDRWRKRRVKLAEKVTRRGSRLVVVPVGGS